MSPFPTALNLRYRAHNTSERTSRGRWIWVPLWPKRGLVLPKVFTPKFYFPFPREIEFRLWHGSNPKPEVPLSTMVRVRSARKSFLTLRPLEHTKSGRHRQNAYTGTYIPMGRHMPYKMAYTQIEGPIVRVCKHASYGSSPLLNPKTIMHAYGYVCKRQKWRLCSKGNVT